jgi:hypothetical protein
MYRVWQFFRELAVLPLSAIPSHLASQYVKLLAKMLRESITAEPSADLPPCFSFRSHTYT